MARVQPPPGMSYVEDVLEGRIVACEWVRLACERHIRDLERAAQGWKYVFNEELAAYACQFFPLFLRHSKGEWAGQPFELSPWQEFCTALIFGWVDRETGFRRFRVVYLEVARKNGKSTYAAGVGMYMFVGDGEPGAEVYTTATKLAQAQIIHAEAIRMRDKSPHLKSRIDKFKNNLSIPGTASKFEPLGRDSDTLDGLNVHCGLVDELHAHKTRDMVEVIDTATGARRQPLLFIITTAGSDRKSVCFEYHDYTKQVLKQVVNDETHFGIIYTLDEAKKDESGEIVVPADSYEDHEVWIKANPNLEISVKIDDLARKVSKAKTVTAFQNTLLRKHFNVWTQAEVRWLNAEKWRACGQDLEIDKFLGRPCFGGLDLSSRIDLTSHVLCFPPIPEDPDKYYLMSRFWIPEDNMAERSRRDKVPFEDWVDQGFIEATPGNAVDYDWILASIFEDAKRFDLLEIAFDRWGATLVSQKLSDEGLTVVEFGQGFASMSNPSKELEKMHLTGQLVHDNNPVLTWCADNVVVKIDQAENIKPDKYKSYERIDGVVAAIMALDRAMRHTENKGGVYTKDRGLVII